MGHTRENSVRSEDSLQGLVLSVYQVSPEMERGSSGFPASTFTY